MGIHPPLGGKLLRGQALRRAAWAVFALFIIAGLATVLPYPAVGEHVPTVTITHPDEGAVVSGVVLVKGTAWDELEVELVEVSFDLGATWHLAVDTSGNGSWATWAYEWDTTQHPNGEAKIWARAWNFHDGHAWDDRFVIVENPQEGNHVPGVKIHEPKHGETVWGLVTVWVCAWDADGNEQIEDVWVRIDQGDWQNATFVKVDGECSWWTYEWDTTQVEDGWHAIYAHAWDGTDESDVDVIEVFVDNVKENHPPNVGFFSPKGGDVVSGVVEVWLCAWDMDGNDQIELVKIRVDQGEWHNATFVEVDNECSWWVYEWDTTQVEDGWHHLSAAATDGQAWGDAHIEVKVLNHPEEKNHPPKVEITEPANGETVSGVVKVWVCAWDPDGNDDVEKVWVRIDAMKWQEATLKEVGGDCSWWLYEWDTTQVEDGEHHIYAIAWDGELHSPVAKIFVIVKNGEEENHAPYVTIVKPANGAKVSGVVNIWICAWDPDGNEDIEQVYVNFDGGDLLKATFIEVDKECSWWLYEWDTTKVDNGWHKIGAAATDGHAWADDSIKVQVCNEPENHAPQIEIVKPEDGAEVSGVVEIHLCAWDPDGNEQVEMVWVKIDAGPKHEATFVKVTPECSWWIYEWDSTQVEDGWHKITAIVWDGIDDGHDVIEVYVENVDDPPKVNIVHPHNGKEVHGIILIHGEAFDDHGVEAVFVRIDEGGWHKAVDTSPDGSWRTWAFQWDTRQVENGEHHIWAKAWDGSQHSEPDKVWVVVANEKHGILGPAEEVLEGAEIPLALAVTLPMLGGLLWTVVRRKRLLADR